MEPLEASNDEAQDAREVVLIVEDDFLIRWPAAEYLRDSGYRVIEAGTFQAWRCGPAICTLIQPEAS